ncbi:hypothetical protein [Stenotrophomonas phage BUCT603B1]|nr:hypothetical protein [Stenotrophomonas phage BUCT603B1]
MTATYKEQARVAMAEASRNLAQCQRAQRALSDVWNKHPEARATITEALRGEYATMVRADGREITFRVG